MQIDNNTPDMTQALGQASQANPMQLLGTPRHQVRQSGGAGDQVQLSNLASALTASDPSKLSQLHAAVGAGTYNVPPAQIASSIIAEILKN
jgi:anti-sigma28 factor (negative regulator of flagellin synthesis)